MLLFAVVLISANSLANLFLITAAFLAIKAWHFVIIFTSSHVGFWDFIFTDKIRTKVFIALFLSQYIYLVMFRYEPEIFPGLIYRIVNPKLVFLIFVNGKVIITGRNAHFLFHTVTSYTFLIGSNNPVHTFLLSSFGNVFESCTMRSKRSFLNLPWQTFHAAFVFISVYQ